MIPHFRFRVALALATATSVATSAPLLRATEDALTLTRALEIGRQRAPSLLAARTHAASAKANIDEVSALYFPTLTANLTGTASVLHDLQPTSPPVPAGQPLLYVYNNDSLAGTASGSVRWTLYDFGRTGGSVHAAKAMHASTAANVATTELGVINDVATAFLTLYYKEQLRDVVRATIAQRETLVALAHGMVAAGLLPALEEVRAAARAETARVQAADAEVDVHDAGAALAFLLGTDPDGVARIAPPRLPTFEMSPQSARSAADALPGVASARADYETRAAIAENARARYLPALSLAVDGYYRFTQSKGTVGGLAVDPPFPLNTASVTGSLVLTVPVLDASLGPNLLGARLDVATFGAIADQVRRDARSEATRAAIAVRAVRTEMDCARKAADDASEVLAIVQARYVQGLSSPLDLIDAESSDSAARITRTQSEFAYALAVVRAFSATGRPLAEAPP